MVAVEGDGGAWLGAFRPPVAGSTPSSPSSARPKAINIDTNPEVRAYLGG
ncbi:MAG: hypothetical protein QOF33_266, partial [Thermomicrobiales bacterium]|nr:hypothetical protein [Thermomicrobiales bacterium]